MSMDLVMDSGFSMHQNHTHLLQELMMERETPSILGSDGHNKLVLDFCCFFFKNWLATPASSLEAEMNLPLPQWMSIDLVTAESHNG